MKQEDFAKKIGVTQQFISMICCGARRISWNTAKQCADVAGNDPSWWMDATAKEIRIQIREIKNGNR